MSTSTPMAPLRRLCDDMRRTAIDRIDARDETLSLLSFYREHVASGYPAVLQGLTDDWAARERWRSNDYLADKLRGTPLTASLTPNGRADACTVVRDGDSTLRMFVSAARVSMDVQEAWDALRGCRGLRPWGHPFDPDAHHRVHASVQPQNGCPDALYPDMGPRVERLGRELFGCAPDARNVWIASSASDTTVHQDGHEHLCVVVRGRKTFYLAPPWEAPLLRRRAPPAGQYGHDGASFTVLPTGRRTRWVDENLAEAYEREEGEFSVMRVVVDVGEVLYLPAMWFQEVHEEEGADDAEDPPCVIAVNFLFDMPFTHPSFQLQKFIQDVYDGTSDDDEAV